MTEALQEKTDRSEEVLKATAKEARDDLQALPCAEESTPEIGEIEEITDISCMTCGTN